MEVWSVAGQMYAAGMFLFNKMSSCMAHELC